MQPKLTLADALDYSPDGAERHRGRQHRLVKLRVPGGGYACHAIMTRGGARPTR
jgi:hypothetical protein